VVAAVQNLITAAKADEVVSNFLNALAIRRQSKRRCRKNQNDDELTKRWLQFLSFPL